uniref:Uncharacterized protein n=1 Tax=Kuetzingia canaliculata TaxID=228262 RepID=A0A1Z1MNW4_KUECA|nr:hypothetical protein [Kuetzingia canaliculata]ARW67780.1 hypothetical protein [Kuetzingia canaliculata]
MNQQLSIDEAIELIINKNQRIISDETETIINYIYEQGEEKQKILLNLIIKRNLINKQKVEVIDGFIFQKLRETNRENIKSKLIKLFPNGIVKLERSLSLDYQILQNLLIEKKFQEADIITQKFLCELVQQKKQSNRKWIYFTEIQFLPLNDLFTIDLLWKIYSKGKFGFSIQKKIWIKNNKKWKKLWKQIGWTENEAMKKYPKEFIWTIKAPEGHLPLSNQLRGTQSLLYLFKSIRW